MDLFINDVSVRTDGAAPYVWNNNDQDDALSNLPEGTYTLRAVATDDDGATSSAERTFTVESVPAPPTNVPPAVSFNLPEAGATLTAPANVVVDVAASDTDGSIDSVDLFINDVSVRTDGASPYVWNNNDQDDALSNLPEGTYTLRAVATDDDGATSSVERTFTVESVPAPPTNVPPAVSFNLPEAGATLTAPANVVVDVAASDTDGSIDSVDLFINDVSVRTDGASPYVWNNNDQDDALSNLPEGTYTLRAVATDDDGAAAAVELIFTVRDDTNSSANLALGGSASQSSTDYGGVPSRAIDGNTNGNYNDRSVTHTATEANAWWEVDLGVTENIGDINIFNRTNNCCADRLTDFTVSVLNADRTTTFSQSFNTAPNPSITVNAGGVTGSIVRIQLNEDNTSLSLAEVEVFAGMASENIPPVVSFNLPTVGTILTAPADVVVDVAASDSDGSIDSVDLFIDDVLVRTDQAAPYVWNNNDQDDALSNLPEGTYTLRAVATDNDGATAAVELIFTVRDDTNSSANLALDGSASQSSTEYGGVPSRAIDGNTNGNYNDRSVTHTVREANAWWEVDLGVTENIGDINIFNRTNDCCADRLTNFTVSVLNADRVTTFSQSFDTAPDPSITVNAGGATGSIVRIQLNEENTPLSLAEVEVFAGMASGNIPPVVSFNLPNAGTTISGPASLEVDVAASDPNGSIVSVELFIDDVFVRVERVLPYLWNNRNQDDKLSNLSDGSYTLRAVATDNEGATTSNEITVIVGNTTSLLSTNGVVSQFRSFPNPFVNTLTVGTSGDEEIYSAQISGVSGVLIKIPVTIEGNEVKFSTENLNAGMYFISLYTSKGVITDKVIKP